MKFPYFIPEQASTVASRVDHLFYYILAVTFTVTIIIAGLLVYFGIKFRRRNDKIPSPPNVSVKLEIAWTLIPFLIFLSMFFWGADVYFAQYHVPREGMDIYLVAKQWMWKFQHIEGAREINELHVPLGQIIRITAASEDVIHSFYVPAFRIKTDIVPGLGRFTPIWFEATRTGRYHIFCAEYCGTNHSGMLGLVEVMEPGAYAAWLSGGGAEGSMADAGAKLFRQFGCITCHSSGAGAKGPMLEGLFGKKQSLSNGESVLADESYIRESILYPNAKITAGYQPIMPTFQGVINEDQLLQLVAYIKSIGVEK
jgi:cytochrome c oxidase subunit 2